MVQIRQLELMNSQLKNGEKYAYTKKFSHYIDNEPLPVAAQQHVDNKRYKVIYSNGAASNKPNQNSLSRMQMAEQERRSVEKQAGSGKSESPDMRVQYEVPPGDQGPMSDQKAA